MIPAGGLRSAMAIRRASRHKAVSMLRESALPDGPAGKEVQDDCQVHEAAPDADVGEIGHPDLVRARDEQVLREVGIDTMGVVAVRGANPAALGFAG